MEFVVKEGQDKIPTDEKVLQIVEKTDIIVGETTLTELKDALSHHEQLKEQYTQSVADLERQIADATKAL